MGKDFGRLDLHVVGDSGDGGATGTVPSRIVGGAPSCGRSCATTSTRSPTTARAPATSRRSCRRTSPSRSPSWTRRSRTTASSCRQHPAEIHGSWFENRIIPLDTTIPDQPGVALLVAAYNRENQRRASAGLPVGVSPHLPTAPHPVAAAATEGTGAVPEENLRYAGTSRLRRLPRGGAEVLADHRARARAGHAQEGEARP